MLDMWCAKNIFLIWEPPSNAPPWKKRFVYKSLFESKTSTFPNTNNLTVIYLPELANRLKNQSAVWAYGIQYSSGFWTSKTFVFIHKDQLIVLTLHRSIKTINEALQVQCLEIWRIVRTNRKNKLKEIHCFVEFIFWLIFFTKFTLDKLNETQFFRALQF